VPDGDYVGDLKEMKVEESRKSGRLQVVSTYMIVDGDNEGSTVKRFDGIDEEISMGYFKGYCEVIGLELPDDLEVLQEICNVFVSGNEDLFNLTVKTKDKYANVYVNGISEFVKSEGEEETEEVEEEEEEVEEEVEEEEEEEEEVTLPVKKITGKPAMKQQVVTFKKGVIKGKK
jgi:hypothetical protein